MDNLEHGLLVGSDFDDSKDEEHVKCYCEWCERPIYYNSEYRVIDGDRVCCKCYERHENKLMEEEMYEE